MICKFFSNLGLLCFDAHMMWSWQEGLLYRGNVAKVEGDLDELYFFFDHVFLCFGVCICIHDVVVAERVVAHGGNLANVEVDLNDFCIVVDFFFLWCE